MPPARLLYGTTVQQALIETNEHAKNPGKSTFPGFFHVTDGLIQLVNDISAFVDQYYSERHMAPSVNEIARGVGIAGTIAEKAL